MKREIKLLVNLAIAVLVVGFLYYVVKSYTRKEVIYADAVVNEQWHGEGEEITSIPFPEKVTRMEWKSGVLYVATKDSLYLLSGSTSSETQDFASLQGGFAVKPSLRDFTVAEDGEIYLLYPTAIEVVSATGDSLRGWEACSELSDYCSIAVAGEGLFTTDAANKNICKYTTEGNFVTFITSPNSFIIPSYTFDIVCYQDTLYCANSGKHLIEQYTLAGEYIRAFGKPGSADGQFAGCCNPSLLTFTHQGDLLTSEKGVNRVTRFSREGAFEQVLYKGMGNAATVVVSDDKGGMFVGRDKRVMVYK